MATTVFFGATEIAGPVSTQLKMPPIHMTELSEGNVRYVQRTKAARITQWLLTFRDLSAADKAALQTFFLSTADGPTNLFTYTHTDGVTVSDCRFMDTELSFERENDNVWHTSVTIEF